MTVRAQPVCEQSRLCFTAPDYGVIGLGEYTDLHRKTTWLCGAADAMRSLMAAERSEDRRSQQVLPLYQQRLESMRDANP